MPLKKVKIIRFVVGNFILLSFLTASWIVFDYQKFTKTPLNIEETLYYEVKAGDNLGNIALQLEKQNIIESALYLRVLAKINPNLQNIKLGEYSIKPRITPKQLLIQLVEGKVKQYGVTIVEGMNIYQVLSLLDDTPYLIKDWPVEETKLAESLKIPNAKVEGWLYPDTYFFTKNSSGLALLKRAKKVMQETLDEEWQNRAVDLPYTSPYDALIMASIVEKETSIGAERDKIAGVFVRRLEKRMRLQTDPTVIYGVWEEYEGDITRKHLKKPTAYNTYVIKGLPPSPIAMPGRAAINAALNPADGEWLYFVATGDGGHKFSKTLEEHNQAVRDYLRKTRR